MTPTTADKQIGEVWVPDVIRAQEFELLIGQRVNKKYEANYPGHGDVVHIPRIPNIEKATKTPGTVWAPYVYTDTEQTITINTYEVTGIKLEEMTRLLSNTDMEKEMKASMGYALGRGVETALANLFQSFSQTVGTLGVEFTWDNLLRANQYLADAGVNSDANDVSLFLSPAAVAGLKKIDQFINSLYRGDRGPAAVSKNMISEDILGAAVYQSNLLRVPSAGQHDCALFDRRAIALIMAQAPKSFTEFQSLDLANVFGMYQLYGFTEVDRYSETPGNITATDEWAVYLAGV
jgi:hypothetical protein